MRARPRWRQVDLMVDFTAREKEFELYFENNGFADFQKNFNCSVEEFKDNYEQFIVEVAEYYNSYNGDSIHPLTAEVCGVIYIDFFATLESTRSMIKYPAVSVLKGEYFATSPRVNIEFKTCEEVMKELLRSYFVNIEFYEDMKKASQSSTPIEYLDIDDLEDLFDEDFPF